MNAREDYNEAVDAQVAQVAEQLMVDWNRKLLARDPRAISDLHNTVLDYMTGDVARELFVLAATGRAIADMRFACLAHDAMYAACKKEAEEQVKRKLRAATEDRSDLEIDMAIERRLLACGLR